MENPSRILLIRPSALGDVCRTVPVLASLRAWRPEARIDWMVQDTFAPAISTHPALTNIVPFPRARVALNRLWRPSAIAALHGFLRQLRDARYDLVIDCQGLGRSGLFALATGAPRRVGHADARELGWLGANERLSAPASAHTVDRMLALVEGIGAPIVRDMRLHTRKEDRSAAVALTGHEPYAVLAPTSRWPGKRWPIERFAELARALLERPGGLRLVIVGGPDERDQCGPLIEMARADSRIIDLIGATPIGVLMAVIEHATLVVANDSAPVHMAVGFDRPLVAIFGPTRTDLVGPYRRDHDVIRAESAPDRNLHKDESFGVAAMRSIPASRVIDAALSRIA